MKRRTPKALKLAYWRKDSRRAALQRVMPRDGFMREDKAKDPDRGWTGRRAANVTIGETHSERKQRLRREAYARQIARFGL